MLQRSEITPDPGTPDTPGALEDLSDSVFRCQMRTKLGDRLLLSADSLDTGHGIIVHPLDDLGASMIGYLELLFTGEQTSGLPLGEHVLDVERTYPDGTRISTPDIFLPLIRDRTRAA